MTAIEHVHVRQTNDWTCGHACLSAVTGVPVEELVERFGDEHPLSDGEEAVVLTELGIFPHVIQPLPSGAFNLIVGWYFIIVPSLNRPGKNHRVVVHAGPDRWDLFDPQEGREGRKFWPRDCMNVGAPLELDAWSHPTALIVMEGHAGNAKRADLYRARHEKVAA